MPRSRLLLALLAGLLALSLAACGGGEDAATDDDTDDPTEAEPSEEPAEEEPAEEEPAEEEPAEEEPAEEEPADGAGDGVAVTNIAVAYDLGGRGDGGFNDLAYAGASQAAEELGAELVEVTARAEDTDADREDRLRLLADSGNNPVIAVGFIYATALAEVAPDYPDVWFGIVDDATVEAPNVAGLVFAEHEGSFLVGAAAALTSETGNIGFVGGVNTPLIEKFEAGYIAGAEAVNPDIEVQSSYLTQPPDFGGFNDPAKGREAATGMYDAGADVVYHAAGGSGSGVFEAAVDADAWAIGVDADQYTITDEGLREVILTSMLKKVDVVTAAFITDVAEGTATAGETVFDLASDGVGYATSGGFIDDLTDQLDGYAEQIISGEITVPDAVG